MRLIDGDALREKMYHEAFETDTDMQRWDCGCWIRYKLFENALEDAPTFEAVTANLLLEKTMKEIAELLYDFHVQADITIEDLADCICDTATTVVRCKDCKHKGEFPCPWWQEEPIPDDWFCSCGERA